MPDDPTTRARAARVRWTLGGILLAGLVVRLIGLDYGLPAVYNVDEIAIMSRALAFATGDPNPHNFVYPTGYFYALFGWIGGYFAVGHLTGVIASAEAFQAQFFSDPTAIYLAGRSFSVVCGLVTVVLVCRLGTRVSTTAGGLAAALFLAAAPFAVRDAHYVKHDVPATLAVTAAVLLLLGAFDRGPHDPRRRRSLLVAGAACGVAFSTHYYTVFLALPMLGVALADARGWRRIVRDVLVVGVASAVAFVALSPFVLVDLRTALADMSANRSIVVDRAAIHGGLVTGLREYGGMLWHDAIGWPVVVLAALGLVVAFRASWRRTALLVAFPAAFFVFISNTVPATRYLNPVLPFIAVLAGTAVQAVVRGGQRWRAWMAGTLMLAATVPGAWASIGDGRLFRMTDTRTLAARYIESHVPAGSTVALQPRGVPLTQSRESLVESLRTNLGDERRASTKFRIRLGLQPEPAPSYRLIFIGDGGRDADMIYVSYKALGGSAGLEALRRLGVTHIAVTRYQEPAPDTVPFLRALAAEARLVQEFSPYRPGTSPEVAARTPPFLHNAAARITHALERPGPRLELWRLASETPQGGW